MKKLFKNIFFLSLPVLVLLGVFFALDPFRIIYRYDDYSENLFVMVNRDFVSTEVYMKNRDKHRYNSFIFGGSRVLAYKTDSWKQHLDSSASPFVFDASGETLFGIYTKLKYIDRSGARIDNCIVLVEEDLTFTYETDSPGHLNIKHPTVAGTSWFNFYITFIRDFFDFFFLKHYFQYLLTKKYVPSMDGYIVWGNIKYDTKTNDSWVLNYDSALAGNPVKYYEDLKDVFYKRAAHIAPEHPQITKRQTEMLKEMKAIFDKHQTNYKLIISPLYNQVEFNPKDVATMEEIFGKERIFNFAGKNDFTAVKENYYESSHFRPFIGDSILKIVYKED